MTPTGTFHFIFCLIAIATGALVLRLPKGTRWHRTVGHGYVWSMLGVVGTSFSMYNLTGTVTPFHLAAVVAALTIGGGMWTVLRRRPKQRWIEAHAAWMAWSYVGLCAALVAESLTRFVMPALASRLEWASLRPLFWTLVVVGSLAVIGTGAWLIRRRLAAAIASTPAAMRRERQAAR